MIYATRIVFSSLEDWSDDARQAVETFAATLEEQGCSVTYEHFEDGKRVGASEGVWWEAE